MMSQVASVLNSQLQGDDKLITGVTKDGRKPCAGELYFALKGENFDGHQFINQALNSGAVGAVVCEDMTPKISKILVKDTRLALGQLAAYWRAKNKVKMIAITGSNGKTSVKEMCRKILTDKVEKNKVLVTQGNLNNDIGMPLTLLNLKQNTKYAVIEMGANHLGEIEYLSQIAKPDVAILNNAGKAHLAGFGSLDNIAKAKAEIFNGLTQSGVAVINGDDDYAEFWKKYCVNKSASIKIKTFSMQNSTATVYAKQLTKDSYQVFCAGEMQRLTLKVLGRHNAMNALAAITATHSLGLPFANIIKSLENFENIKGRLTLKKTQQGFLVIDDSYNANPLSVTAAIDVLSKVDGCKKLVLGDMAELGRDAEKLHSEIGLKAKNAKIDFLYVTGKLSLYTAKAFGENAFYFKNKKQLIDNLKENLSSKDVILVKGSRSAKMEEVVEKLLNEKN